MNKSLTQKRETTVEYSQNVLRNPMVLMYYHHIIGIVTVGKGS
jgi:hypothetical protein